MLRDDDSDCDVVNGSPSRASSRPNSPLRSPTSEATLTGNGNELQPLQSRQKSDEDDERMFLSTETLARLFPFWSFFARFYVLLCANPVRYKLFIIFAES